MPDLSKALADGVRAAFQPLLDTLWWDFMLYSTLLAVFIVWQAVDWSRRD